MVYLANLDVFLSIAEESYEAMKESYASGRRPKPDGTGDIFTYDATRYCFKQACITVAFAAMYFEALVYLRALNEHGEREALRIDRMLYEQRLPAIGISDPALIAMAEEFRKARKELVHEKAIELGRTIEPVPRYAQDIAEHAMSFLAALRVHLVAA